MTHPQQLNNTRSRTQLVPNSRLDRLQARSPLLPLPRAVHDVIRVRLDAVLQLQQVQVRQPVLHHLRCFLTSLVSNKMNFSRVHSRGLLSLKNQWL